MKQLAAFIGTLIGYSVGYILKIAHAELKAFLVACIKEAISDKADYGGTNTIAQSEFKRVWDDSFGSATGNGGVHTPEDKDKSGPSGTGQ